MNALDHDAPANPTPPTQTTTVTHDWEGDCSLAVTIVTGIARLADVDPEDVPQIYDQVDPDSLDSLFEPTRRTGDRSDGHLWIPVDDYGVTVHGDGTVVVRSLNHT
ncbi:HalOD1 output domain-containing protein [Halovivax limisalsi]|uniref:HalOD1 output domain-containing protein n=1 Tax=Halovivax limisalsi TaxID=1453760 RepID=UPI001FFDE4C4|nr:HalOD1 output domain-containing protein [Halovivax limisalsi]